MKNIWILGGANIDICGTAVKKLIEKDSNIGNIEISLGGVGRNIAQACAVLSSHISYVKVNFVTCFSHDHYGNILMEDCQKLGIDCSFSVVGSSFPTSIYLAILDHNKDLSLGMSDMRILEDMTIDRLKDIMAHISPEDILVIDSNLDNNLLEYVFKNAPCSIASDPVSINKINKLLPFISNINIFKPNKIEAEALTGMAIEDDASASKALSWFMDRGVSEILITLADRGILLGFDNNKKYYIRHRKLLLDNVTGGGDSFLGGYVLERICGKNPLDAAKFAVCTAVLTIESHYHERRLITQEKILKNIDKMDISFVEI